MALSVGDEETPLQPQKACARVRADPGRVSQLVDSTFGLQESVWTVLRFFLVGFCIRNCKLCFPLRLWIAELRRTVEVLEALKDLPQEVCTEILEDANAVDLLNTLYPTRLQLGV